MTSSISRAIATRKSSHFERGRGRPCSSKSSSPSIHLRSVSNHFIVYPLVSGFWFLVPGSSLLGTVRQTKTRNQEPETRNLFSIRIDELLVDPTAVGGVGGRPACPIQDANSHPVAALFQNAHTRIAR